MVRASPPRRRVYDLKARDARFTVEERERRFHETPPLCACGCGSRVGWDAGRARWRRYASKGCYHPLRPHQDPVWLREHYEEQRLSIPDIAAIANISPSAVAKQMKRHGIARRSASESHRGLQSGEQNPSWRGGVTPERQKLYKTPEWKALLSAVLERDGFRCMRCGADKTRRRALHAHHLAPWADVPELRTDLSNLVTLCAPCHLWVHSRKNLTSEYLRPS